MKWFCLYIAIVKRVVLVVVYALYKSRLLSLFKKKEVLYHFHLWTCRYINHIKCKQNFIFHFRNIKQIFDCSKEKNTVAESVPTYLSLVKVRNSFGAGRNSLWDRSEFSLGQSVLLFGTGRIPFGTVCTPFGGRSELPLRQVGTPFRPGRNSWGRSELLLRQVGTPFGLGRKSLWGRSKVPLGQGGCPFRGRSELPLGQVGTPFGADRNSFWDTRDSPWGKSELHLGLVGTPSATGRDKAKKTLLKSISHSDPRRIQAEGLEVVLIRRTISIITAVLAANKTVKSRYEPNANGDYKRDKSTVSGKNGSLNYRSKTINKKK